MRSFVLAACVTLAAMPAPSQAAQTSTTLTSLQDAVRPLLVFAGAQDPRVEQQYREIADHAAQASERDLRIVLLTKSLTKAHGGSQPPQAFFSPAEQQRLRKQFHIAPGEFAAILVGKDGGEKLRSSTPMPWQRLASIVDAMPMRQSEMHRN